MRLAGKRELASPRWHVAVDFRYALPTVPFPAIYARWTRQNHQWKRRGCGRYRLFLAHGLDTHTLPNGTTAWSSSRATPPATKHAARARS